jgi:hypothetical protein
MRRTSSSVETPCAAARAFSRWKTSSSIFRTLKLAIAPSEADART